MDVSNIIQNAHQNSCNISIEKVNLTTYLNVTVLHNKIRYSDIRLDIVGL